MLKCRHGVFRSEEGKQGSREAGRPGMDTAQKKENEKETADLQKSLTETLMKAGALKVGFGDLTSLPET